MQVMRIALAILVLTVGAGSVLAQTQSQAKGSNAAVPPAISSASSAAQDPGVNPSAAGAQAGDVPSGRVRESFQGAGEHSGSKGLSANTHPLAAAKANRKLRRRQRTEQILQGATSGGQAQQGSVASGR